MVPKELRIPPSGSPKNVTSSLLTSSRSVLRIDLFKQFSVKYGWSRVKNGEVRVKYAHLKSRFSPLHKLYNEQFWILKFEAKLRQSISNLEIVTVVQYAPC
jgi:hypothetical protein